MRRIVRALQRALINTAPATIRCTPTNSPLYPVMVGCDNWLHALNQPATAMRQLGEFLLTYPADMAV